MHKCERPGCEVLTANAKFCSRSCAATINNQNAHKREASTAVCKCGKTFIRKDVRWSKICRDCKEAREKERAAVGQRTLGFYTQKHITAGHHASWRWSEVRSHCRWKNRHRPQKCQACGYTRRVECAHIKALAEFSENDVLDVINDPSNVLILCPNHHTEFDDGHHPKWREEIFERINRRQSRYSVMDNTSASEAEDSGFKSQ